jgi:hypothetical protein
MIVRRKKQMNLAMQLYRHDNIIVFRIYAQVKEFPRFLMSHHCVYELKVQVVPPYSCWQQHQYVRDFSSHEIAWSILLERIRSFCSQFGFDVPYTQLRIWEKNTI